MKIEEIPEKAKVTLDIRFDKNHLRHEGIVLRVDEKKKYILMTAILKEGKPISLKESHVNVDMTVSMPDAKPVLFSDVEITSVSTKDLGICYMVNAKTQGKEINRRKSFRCYMGFHVPMKINNNISVSAVLLKDVSTSGFSFIYENKLDIGDLICVVINDKIEDYNTEYSFNLLGRIVRKEDFKGKESIYGCVIMNYPKDINKYITEKERQRIRKARQ